MVGIKSIMIGIGSKMQSDIHTEWIRYLHEASRKEASPTFLIFTQVKGPMHFVIKNVVMKMQYISYASCNAAS